MDVGVGRGSAVVAGLLVELERWKAMGGGDSCLEDVGDDGGIEGGIEDGIDDA